MKLHYLSLFFHTSMKILTTCQLFLWRWAYRVYLPVFTGQSPNSVINDPSWFQGCGGNSVWDLNTIEFRWGGAVRADYCQSMFRTCYAECDQTRLWLFGTFKAAFSLVDKTECQASFNPLWLQAPALGSSHHEVFLSRSSTLGLMALESAGHL